jgi:hypothetical protein
MDGSSILFDACARVLLFCWRVSICERGEERGCVSLWTILVGLVGIHTSICFYDFVADLPVHVF